MAQYKPHKKQVKAHRAFLLEGYKRGVLLWGRQSGKTMFSVGHGWLSAVLRQGRYFIVFKTYKQAKEVVWRQYIPLIPKELIAETNASDLLITFKHLQGKVNIPGLGVIQLNHDEDLPASTLQLLGSDQADSHRGFRAHGIVFDEYADQDPDNFRTVYEPMLSTTDGWILFMGTPKGFNHFYDMIQFAKKEEDWFYQQATWRDSPFVTPGFVEKVRSEAAKTGALSSHMQEYELEFRAVQGAVYPKFDRDIHVVKPSNVPQEGTVFAGVDFGWHTTAIVFVKVDYKGDWYLFDEIYAHEMIQEDVIPIIRDKTMNMKLQLMVGDSAQAEHIASYQRFFPIVPVSKITDSIPLGINILNQKLTPRRTWDDADVLKPSLYIASNCTKFIKEFEAYKYPEEKADRNPSEQPIKKDDHGPDALRYLALHFKFGNQKEERGFKKPEWNEYGLMV